MKSLIHGHNLPCFPIQVCKLIFGPVHDPCSHLTTAAAQELTPKTRFSPFNLDGHNFFTRQIYSSPIFAFTLVLSVWSSCSITKYLYPTSSTSLILASLGIIISNGNRTEWSTIQGVIGRVIWNYEHDYPWIVRHEVLLPINCVNNKMRETFLVSSSKKACQNLRKTFLNKSPLNFVHVCFQSAPVNLLT